ncbi:hypothetical protein BDN72DRAFT_896686 [Pluteus cervinus]|uniref:Uncharacterized protein n=1 Tax=Pluteus cervinus TaxID=181527 RepID=A0ACD3AWE3_9AGAR|nr:hypothetical protein BDN72DRAFT_896686 [Pluteus cervinus]
MVTGNLPHSYFTSSGGIPASRLRGTYPITFFIVWWDTLPHDLGEPTPSLLSTLSGGIPCLTITGNLPHYYLRIIRRDTLPHDFGEPTPSLSFLRLAGYLASRLQGTYPTTFYTSEELLPSSSWAPTPTLNSKLYTPGRFASPLPVTQALTPYTTQ